MKFLSKKDLKLKTRRPDSHKGDNGRVLIIGGSSSYVGAPALAAMAALRAGCDLAVVAAPEKTAWAINSFSPDIITIKLKGDCFDVIHSRALAKTAENFDSVLIGNGIGLEKETAKFTVRIIKNIIRMEKPVIIDADALKIIGKENIANKEGNKEKLLNEMNNAIFTPHQKEFELMTGLNLPIGFEERPKVLHNVLNTMEGENVILLKGRVDIIAAKDYETNTAFNQTGNEGMTTGGTGDVLAGITASLAAQKNALFTSACAAAFVNGLAGDYLMKKTGIGFTAADMLDYIPIVMKQIRK